MNITPQTREIVEDIKKECHEFIDILKVDMSNKALYQDFTNVFMFTKFAIQHEENNLLKTRLDEMDSQIRNLEKRLGI